MVSYYRAFAPKSEAVNYMDYRATLKVAHKFCGPVFQSECTLLVIQPWHLIAFELTFCVSCSFVCGCVLSFYQSLTLDELAVLSATSSVDLLVRYY